MKLSLENTLWAIALLIVGAGLILSVDRAHVTTVASDKARQECGHLSNHWVHGRSAYTDCMRRVDAGGQR